MPSMREPTYFILASLAAGRAHGYGIVKRANELSVGRVRLTAGTLYGALDRLVEQGLVCAAGEETVGGRLRRYYDLTEEGSAALRAEAGRLQVAALAFERATHGFLGGEALA
jgi:PadR family transcriptional regulator, regulatory protein PadR